MPEIKEVLNTTKEIVSPQPREIVDQKPETFVPNELKSFLRKIEENPVPTSVTNDNGQPQLTSTEIVEPKISLPITRTTFVSVFKKKIDNVGLWLSKFLFREIKLKDGSVSFKPDDT
jgi:hypothetical protein